MSRLSRLPRAVGPITASTYDILGAWCLTLAAFLVIPDLGPVLRTLLGATTLYLVPGYVLLAALFPRTAESSPPLRSGAPNARLTVPERLALSFGTSIALVPLFGNLLSRLSYDYGPRSELGLLVGFVGVVGCLAAGRRMQVAADERFTPPLKPWLLGVWDEYDARSPGGKVVFVVFACSILLSGTTAAYVIAVPNSGEQFTDFHLVTAGDDGDRVSAGYPVALQQGERANLTVGVRSFEGESTDYVVVVTMERLVDSGGTSKVVERRELSRFSRTVDGGDRWHETHTFEPSTAGQNLQLNYYLYRGDAPETATEATAYRHVYVWVDVAPNPTGGNADAVTGNGTNG